MGTIMWVKIGEDFVNLNNVFRVRFSTGADGQLHAHIETTQHDHPDTHRLPLGPDCTGPEAEKLRAILAQAADHPQVVNP